MILKLRLSFALKIKRLDDQPSAGTEFTKVSFSILGKNRAEHLPAPGTCRSTLNHTVFREIP